jgi:hypothetical protein
MTDYAELVKRLVEVDPYPDPMLRSRIKDAKAAIEALVKERDEWRDELHKIADVVEPHWKGAGMPLKAEWIIKEYCHLGCELTAAREQVEALVKENARTHEKLRLAVMTDTEYVKAVDQEASTAIAIAYDCGFQAGREAGIREAAAIFTDEATDETAKGWIYIDVIRRILALLKKEKASD